MAYPSYNNRGATNWKPKKRAPLALKKLPAALEAHNRAQAVSDEIRLVLGPWTAAGTLPEHRRVTNSVVESWRARMAEHAEPPRISSTDSDPLEELRKAMAARKRAESRIMAAARAAKEAAGASTVASELGMTRQGVYAMLARSGA